MLFLRISVTVNLVFVELIAVHWEKRISLLERGGFSGLVLMNGCMMKCLCDDAFSDDAK